MIAQGRRQRSAEILLVEDSAADARLAIEALREVGASPRVTWVRDGTEALDLLSGLEAEVDTTTPDLVLLDLNLPRMGGRDLLSAIRADSGLRRIPVVVLSTSGATEDVADAYRLKADAYVQKPIELDEFVTVIRAIDDLWLSKAPRDSQQDAAVAGRTRTTGQHNATPNGSTDTTSQSTSQAHRSERMNSGR